MSEQSTPQSRPSLSVEDARRIARVVDRKFWLALVAAAGARAVERAAHARLTAPSNGCLRVTSYRLPDGRELDGYVEHPHRRIVDYDGLGDLVLFLVERGSIHARRYTAPPALAREYEGSPPEVIYLFDDDLRASRIPSRPTPPKQALRLRPTPPRKRGLSL